MLADLVEVGPHDRVEDPLAVSTVHHEERVHLQIQSVTVTRSIGTYIQQYYHQLHIHIHTYTDVNYIETYT